MRNISTTTYVKKLYLQQIFLYGTIGAIMTLPVCLQPYCHPTIASFFSFFLVIMARALCETKFLHGNALNAKTLKKIPLFSLLTAGLMTIFLVLVKQKLGWYAVPLSILFASQVVGKMKARFWPNNGEASLLAQKIRTQMTITYSFYAIFVPLTIVLFSYCDVSLFYSVAIGYFVAAFFEELSTLYFLYKERLALRQFLFSLTTAALSASLAAIFIWALINFLSLAGQPATIIGILTLKLLQPLSRVWFLQ